MLLLATTNNNLTSYFMSRTGFAFLALFLSVISLNAQVIINEASNRNYDQIADEEGEYNDWIELYNPDTAAVDLSEWALSDNRKEPVKWKFGKATIPAGGFLFVNASGKNRNSILEEVTWESAVLPTDTFSYIVPAVETPTDWFLPDFNDSTWAKGIAGFGFGDNDDQTVLPENTIAVYLRRKFTISDTSAILNAVFHADYDDGFVVYLNGTVIASANMGENPQWNSTATANREAEMYAGGVPALFEIDSLTLKSIIRPGENVLCIEAHNNNASSTDLSIIPFFSFSLKEGYSFFQPVPDWFDAAPATQLHTNFKISSGGEKIFLSHDSVFVDSLKVPALLVDHSYGRVTDGASQYGIFTSATPGASNNSSVANTQGYTGKPIFNYAAGFYDKAIEVTITPYAAGDTIRYSLDGSEPTATSFIYKAPLKISVARCLKARCFSSGKLPGETSVATYFINAKYTLPVLSVSTNNSNLYGTTGIFTNWEQTWDVPSYAEYFDTNQHLAFSQRAGMQVDGGAGGSRSNNQHSFRIEPGNDALGDGDLDYKLMPRRANRNDFSSFYVRNGSNQYLTLPYKDALEVTALGRNTYTYYSAYHPIVVYLNGSYFGVYELREKINEDYLKYNYHLDTDSLDLLGVSYFKGSDLEATRGSIEPFIADYNRFVNMDPLADNYLATVDSFLDIQCYTDYIIAENWVANNDWPGNNIKLFRCKGTRYRWQWAINDLEWGLYPNGWTTSSFDHFSLMDGYGTSNYFSSFWFNMMKNPDYKAYFINRYADLMNTNYLFSVIGSLEDEMFNEIYPEMGGEFSRWKSSSNLTAQLNTFTTNHNTFRSELQKRSNVVRGQILSHYSLKNKVTVTLDIEPQGAGSIQISTITPSVYPWQGIYFTGVPITVTALANPGYRFANWESNAFFTDVYNAVQTGTFKTTAIRLSAHFEPDESSNAGVLVSEINYKTGNSFAGPDWLEFCNFSQSSVNLKDWYFTDEDSSHVFTFTKDLVLSPYQRMVVASDYGDFERLYPSVSLYPDEFDFGLGCPSDEIHLYNKNHEKVLEIKYSDIYPWALSDDFTGRTLELRQLDGNLSQPQAWFRGCIGGSPGTAYQACDEEVVSSPVVADAGSFDVKVYPVPARDYIHISVCQENADKNCTARLYDLMGNLVKTISFEDATAGWNSAYLSLDDVIGNLFFLKVNTGEHEKTMKVVKIE